MTTRADASFPHFPGDPLPCVPPETGRAHPPPERAGAATNRPRSDPASSHPSDEEQYLAEWSGIVFNFERETFVDGGVEEITGGGSIIELFDGLSDSSATIQVGGTDQLSVSIAEALIANPEGYQVVLTSTSRSTGALSGFFQLHPPDPV